jgi:hypothetical protein
MWPAPATPSAAVDPFGSNYPQDPFAPNAINPAVDEPVSSIDRPPTSIWVAFGALIAAALVHLFSAIVLIMWIYDVKGQATNAADGLLDEDPTGISSQQVGGWAGDLATSVSVFLAVVFVLVAATYVAIALLVKAGRNGARITATVFACVSVFGLLAGPTGWLIVALGIGAVVAMWLKPSSAYFNYRRMVRSGS